MPLDHFPAVYVTTRSDPPRAETPASLPICPELAVRSMDPCHNLGAANARRLKPSASFDPAPVMDEPNDRPGAAQPSHTNACRKCLIKKREQEA